MAKFQKPDVRPQVLRFMARLDEIRPDDLKDSEHCKLAKVNSNYLQNLREGKEPGLFKADRLASVAGVTLAELMEGVGRPFWPNAEQLASMIDRAMGEIPAIATRAEMPRYVAQGLLKRLERFRSHGIIDDDDEDIGSAPDTPAPTPTATTEGAPAEPRIQANK